MLLQASFNIIAQADVEAPLRVLQNVNAIIHDTKKPAS
jgi:hypothetical protein